MTLHKHLVAGLALALAIAEPALAQTVDLSPIATLLQSIVDALTGTLGVVIATLALIGCFLAWLVGYIDFSRLLWVVVAIVGVASSATIVATMFTTT